ncbi:hypothetical protein GGS23DRAFT_593943 [Durotheca rogersii]|uniref:uncharacterized protein n=1 Tax=Durotheca rogersii TaxID=419775 RepID=UPI00222025E5|nr:uncharacterized protein GGS23DRAFT_593943 [Durotheca rogersii]KAI5865768.1 hypothetical protein GGS23DRAFT_593943 [Durotheca rogersii]
MARTERDARREWSRDEYEQHWKESRLSLPPVIRIPAATAAAFGVGMALGVAHGSQTAGLRFRAEHAHKLPTNTTGWYLYHKSKNYNMALAGLKEGIKVGAKLGLLSASMFCAENLFDVYRGKKDFLSTGMASLAVAGGFSFWNRFSAPETARTARKGLAFGLAYGLVQDAVSLAKGRPVGYVESIRRHIGKATQSDERTT